MTLCAAWIRKTGSVKEIVFATDSRLSTGEWWDTGIKLFDLQRGDCLLCFAGDTARAYPLMLNLRNSIQFSPQLSDARLDVHVVLEHLIKLFTDLCLNIDVSKRHPKPDIHELRSEAKFLFGGWSWQHQKLCIWNLAYSKDAESFVATALYEDEERAYFFIGDDLDEAEDKLSEEMKRKGKRNGGSFDMEPLTVLATMSRDETRHPSIGGALQVAKVYKSGHNEFFGVMWQSVEGKPHFLGKELHEFNKPPVRFLDPDTGEVLENLPPLLGKLNGFDFGTEQEFVSGCYPNDSLKDEISEGDKAKLSVILKDAAYINFTSEIKNHWLVASGDTGAHDE
jgi:hypothetical protein